MLESGPGSAGRKAGRRLVAMAFGLAMACGLPQMPAQARPGISESLDRTSARAFARTLFPIIADDVVDGERGIMRGLPAGGDVGLIYRFRLRPEAAQYRPYCRMRIVELVYEFPHPPDDTVRQADSVADYDLLAIKRRGGFEFGGVNASVRYRQLSPAPQSHEEQVVRCAAADRDLGWVYAADDAAFEAESDYLLRLRTALAPGHDGVRLACRRDGSTEACPISAELVLRIIAGTRQEFRTIRLNDGRDIAQFFYFDPNSREPNPEMKSIIIEGHSDRIESVTLVYGEMIRAII